MVNENTGAQVHNLSFKSVEQMVSERTDVRTQYAPAFLSEGGMKPMYMLDLT